MKRVLYLSWDKVPSSGGARVTERNLRFLASACGDEGLRRFNPGWRAFYPWPRHWKRALVRAASLGRPARALRRELAAFAPSFLALDHSGMALPDAVFRRFPTLVFCHNVEADYARAAGERAWEIEQTARVERETIRRATRVVALSRRDAARFGELYGRGADYVLPPTFPDAGAETPFDPDGPMLFVGSDFFGNTQGLFAFIERCLGRIGRPLVVAGRGMERYRGRYPALEAKGRLDFVGSVDNLSALYRAASCVVLPIAGGGGVKTKTIEALMWGKRVYGTDEAFAGCDGVDAVATRCRDDDAFVRELARPRPSPGARDYFLRRFSDEAQRARFLSWLGEALP